jgi:hypothetical protein
VFPSAERNDCGNQKKFYADNLDASSNLIKRNHGWEFG